MIKGHCCIELHNHRTGFRDRVAANNLVTNAIPDLVKIMGGSYNGSADAFMPIATKALGGVLLFDNTLEESADNIYLPSDAHVVAYSDRSVNSDNPMRGSFNSLESGETMTGYTSVWDFSTSQANGTIKAVSLVNVNTGAGAARENTYGIKAPGGTGVKYGIKYDRESSMLYSVEVSSGYDDLRYTYRIVRQYFPLYKYRINDNVTASGDSESVATFTSVHNVPPYMLGYDGYTYYATYTNDLANQNATIKYCKLDLSDWTAEDVELSVSGVTFTGTMVISGGYAYARSYDGIYVFKINLSDASDIISFPYASSMGEIYKALPNGNVRLLVRTDYNTGRSGLLYPDGKYIMDATGVTDGFGSRSVAYHRNICDSIFQTSREDSTICSYLGTIFNLPSPIQKTASTSMKVIYTLTDVV